MLHNYVFTVQKMHGYAKDSNVHNNMIDNVLNCHVVLYYIQQTHFYESSLTNKQSLEIEMLIHLINSQIDTFLLLFILRHETLRDHGMSSFHP